MAATITITTYSYANAEARRGWVAEFVSGEPTVKVTVSRDGKLEQRRMPRQEAKDFVLKQQAAGRTVEKSVVTREVKPVPADPTPKEYARAVVAPKFDAMPEHVAVAPVGRPSAVVNTLNRITAHAVNAERALEVAERFSEREVSTEDFAAQVKDAEVKPAERKNSVRDGLYTVVMQDGERRTIRVKTYDEGNMAGKTIMSFLAGPNNEHDYTGFAFLDGSRVIVWKRFRDQNSLAVAAAKVLADPKTAGQAYAVESGKCYRCNRTLTVPSSIDAGLGPICAGRE